MLTSRRIHISKYIKFNQHRKDEEYHVHAHKNNSNTFVQLPAIAVNAADLQKQIVYIAISIT